MLFGWYEGLVEIIVEGDVVVIEVIQVEVVQCWYIVGQCVSGYVYWQLVKWCQVDLFLVMQVVVIIVIVGEYYV